MRRIPGIALLVSLALALGATLAHASSAPAARPVDAEQTVSAARFARQGAAHAASAWRTTGPLRSPRRFELLGVRAGRGGHGDGSVGLRVHRPGGAWSRWVTVHAGEPVWSGAARVYQLRVAGPPRAVRVHFVAVGARAATPPPAHAAAGIRPPIVPRSAWDPHGECPPRVTPAYGRVDFAIVHHTVSLNAYAPGSVPRMLLAICRFHRNGNRWNDLGYNLLVDRFGRVWEGRAGGAEQPVIGAQAQGWNSVSTGVAAIGDFGSGGLPAPALRSLARVLAWKLSLAGVPARGAIGEVSIGGDLNRWRSGASVRFERIAAHRDGVLTDCPGAGLVAQLPALRELTARLLPAPRELVTISPAPAPQPAGEPVVLTGRLARADGRRPAGAPVTVQRRLDGAWVDFAAATTGADGIWTAALPLSENAELRAVHAVSGLASATVAVPIRAGIALQVSRRVVRAGGEVEVSGTTAPTKGRVRVILERRLERGRVRRVRSEAVTTIDGVFAHTLRLSTAGDYRIRITTPSDRTNAVGVSRAIGVRVRPARS